MISTILQAISSSMQLKPEERDGHVRSALKEVAGNRLYAYTVQVSPTYSKVGLSIRLDPYTVEHITIENGVVDNSLSYNEFYGFDGELVALIYQAYEASQEDRKSLLDTLSFIESSTLNYRMHCGVSFVIESEAHGTTIKWVEGDDQHIVTLHSFMEYRKEKA